MIRAAGGARSAPFAYSMLPRLEYYGDSGDDDEDDETRILCHAPSRSLPKEYPSGVRKKQLPARFAELYSSVEPTGSDIHAPIHRLDGRSVLPSTAALAARRAPWTIDVAAPEFEPLPMPVLEPVSACAHRIESEARPAAPVAEKRSHTVSAIFGALLGVACGALLMSIANGTITRKDARSAVIHATHLVDAVLARH